MSKNLYAIKSPSGVLIGTTVSSNPSNSWGQLYLDVLYKSMDYRNSHNPTKKAYSNGWRCVKVTISEVKNA